MWNSGFFGALRKPPDNEKPIIVIQFANNRSTIESTMPMRRLFFPLAFGPLASIAQPAPSPLITEASLSFGFQLEGGALLSDDDWRRMLPGSSLLLDDLPQGGRWANSGGFQPDFSRGQGLFNPFGVVSASTGLALFRNRAGESRYDNRLRVGVLYGGGDWAEGYWARSSSAAYDTLISMGTGELFVLDSSWSESYSASHSRSRIGVEASFIAHRITGSRFSWSVGVGLQLGAASSGYAEVTHSITRSTERPAGGSDYEYELLGSERFRTPATAYAGLHGLFGIDLRLGKTSPFWSALHLYAEMRPAIMLRSLPNLPAQAGGAWQNLFGLRIDLR